MKKKKIGDSIDILVDGSKAGKQTERQKKAKRIQKMTSNHVVNVKMISREKERKKKWKHSERLENYVKYMY